MSTFSAYFDASGTKRGKVLTVAGFVSRISKWIRFEQEWADILKSEGIISFRMSNFASSTGEFQGWKGQTERRRNFIDRLIMCAKKNTNKGFAVSVILEDYARIDSEYTFHETAGHPYALCASTCMALLRKWAANKRTDPNRVLMLIEQGDDDQGQFMHYAKLAGTKTAKLTKEDASAFQAGDLAGWKHRTVIQTISYGNITTLEQGNDLIRSLEQMDPIVQDGGVFDEKALRGICEASGIARRMRKLSA